MDTELEQFITGFAEGDGYIGQDGPWLTLKVCLSQKERDILDHINSLMPNGTFSDNVTAWQLWYSGRYAKPVIEMFSKYVVSITFTARLNALLEKINLKDVAPHTPTITWLAGFWYADGTSGSSGSYLHLTFVQKDPDVLNRIKQVFGGGVYPAKWRSGAGYQWTPNSKDSVTLAQEFLKYPFCRVKAERLRKNLVLTGNITPTNSDEATKAITLRQKRLNYEKERYATHKDQRHTYNARKLQEAKAIREYIREHPEVMKT